MRSPKGIRNRAVLLVLVAILVMGQNLRAADPVDAVGPIAEIVTKTDDGYFAMRDVQLIGRGIPCFKARVYNGLQHDWVAPKFLVTYKGHASDGSKEIRQWFVVEGQCTWPKGHECTLSLLLDFPLFVIESYEFKLDGGLQKKTPAEQAIADRDAAKAAAARTEREIREQADAAEKQKKIRAACAGLYNRTAEKKVKDLTVKEEQQIRACQALDLYPPE